jgi:hypothetical protein
MVAQAPKPLTGAHSPPHGPLHCGAIQSPELTCGFAASVPPLPASPRLECPLARSRPPPTLPHPHVRPPQVLGSLERLVHECGDSPTCSGSAGPGGGGGGGGGKDKGSQGGSSVSGGGGDGGGGGAGGGGPVVWSDGDLERAGVADPQLRARVLRAQDKRDRKLRVIGTWWARIGGHGLLLLLGGPAAGGRI